VLTDPKKNRTKGNCYAEKEGKQPDNPRIGKNKKKRLEVGRLAIALEFSTGGAEMDMDAAIAGMFGPIGNFAIGFIILLTVLALILLSQHKRISKAAFKRTMTIATAIGLIIAIGYFYSLTRH
jgi:hypothetical protein